MTPPRQTTRQQRAGGNAFKQLLALGRNIAFLTLAALASPISQASLRPVYGALPPAVNHQEAMTLTPLLGFVLYAVLPKPRRKGIVARVVALWACCVPVLDVYLARFSGALGPIGGPILFGLFFCHGLVVPSVYSAAEALEASDLSRILGPYGSRILPSVAGTVYVVACERVLQHGVQALLSSRGGQLFTPATLQLGLAALYTLLAPSRTLFMLAAPALLLHSLFVNAHLASGASLARANATLLASNWTLLDRRWSTTGYLSVLQNVDEQYRVLRCDHSLLGGEWLATPERRANENWQVDEPIYAVFSMLEAVRLVERPGPPLHDSEAHALIIGLGIGTAAKALITHGIATTILELDPAVHDLATTHFHLPPNHTAELHDAVPWVSSRAAAGGGGRKYDYILHDVFTGGAEPPALFTHTFLTNLYSLLSPGGVMAINYAADPAAKSTQSVLRTIASVAGPGCRSFRDGEPGKGAGAGAQSDFANVVVFCTAHRDANVVFRPPRESDFLASLSRRAFLLPRPEWEIPFPPPPPLPLPSGVAGNEAGPRTSAREEKALLAAGASAHWRVMRAVVPDVVWEVW